MKYRCEKCREVFTEEEVSTRVYVDYVAHGDTYAPMYSADYFCPYCGEEDPEEFYGEVCPECGGIVESTFCPEDEWEHDECIECGFRCEENN